MLISDSYVCELDRFVQEGVCKVYAPACRLSAICRAGIGRHDLGDRNEELLATYPGRDHYRGTYDPERLQPQLEKSSV